MTSTQTIGATDRQVAFIQSLIQDLVGQDNAAEAFQAGLEAGLLETTRTASGWIDHLKAQPRQPKAKAPQAPAAEEGVYLVDGTVYKVQRAVHGSGNLYAKRLDPETGSWEYAPGMVRRLTPAQRLTLEQAAAYGALYGVCAVCGRTLTDEESIARGIGPICAGRL